MNETDLPSFSATSTRRASFRNGHLPLTERVKNDDGLWEYLVLELKACYGKLDRMEENLASKERRISELGTLMHNQNEAIRQLNAHAVHLSNYSNWLEELPRNPFGGALDRAMLRRFFKWGRIGRWYVRETSDGTTRYAETYDLVNWREGIDLTADEIETDHSDTETE